MGFSSNWLTVFLGLMASGLTAIRDEDEPVHQMFGSSGRSRIENEIKRVQINGINCGAPDVTPKTERPSDPMGPVIPIARVVGPPDDLVIGQQKCYEARQSGHSIAFCHRGGFYERA